MISELKSNIEKALDEIRPFLQNDGGDISLISIEDDKIVKVPFEYYLYTTFIYLVGYTPFYRWK